MRQRNKPRNKNRNLDGVTPRSAPKIATALLVQTEGEYSVRNIVRLDPGFCVLTAVACALVVAGLNVAAVDTNGDRPLYFYLAVGAGSLPVPPTAQRIAAARRPNNDWHYYFNPDLGNPATNILLSVGLLGFIAALLIGLLLVVFVVLPIMAVTYADRLVAQNLLDTSDKHRKANVLSSRLIVLLLTLIFVMAVCLTVGKEFSKAQPFPTALRSYGGSVEVDILRNYGLS